MDFVNAWLGKDADRALAAYTRDAPDYSLSAQVGAVMAPAYRLKRQQQEKHIKDSRNAIIDKRGGSVDSSRTRQDLEESPIPLRILIQG